MASSREAESLDKLATEARRADTDYASRSTQDLVGLMNEEDASVPAAVAAVADELAAAIDAVVARLAAGGRLVYVGAGSSAASQSSTRRNAKGLLHRARTGRGARRRRRALLRRA